MDSMKMRWAIWILVNAVFGVATSSGAWAITNHNYFPTFLIAAAAMAFIVWIESALLPDIVPWKNRPKRKASRPNFPDEASHHGEHD